MPPGTPFNGFIHPYPIRVDEFSSPPSLTTVPALHLLSHTHSDHIVGLSSKSFASTIICSEDAKEMLLKHEVYKERALKDMELRSDGRVSRTFQHLKVSPLVIGGRTDYQGSRDLLKTLPLDKPTSIEMSETQRVTVTLLDANHCPGSVMFLVEGEQGSILHTGDFRAETWWVDYMRRNKFLEPYLATEDASIPHDEISVFQKLDAIYLDTACLFSETEVPSKHDAVTDLIRLISLFPGNTLFYINSWTWGYEDVLKGIARRFNCKIHVDSYKYNIYARLSDPTLRAIVTENPAGTRFHACERFGRCSYVAEPPSGTGQATKVVYINPVTIGKVKWAQYLEQTTDKLRGGGSVDCLLVALSRHSCLPELRNFVSMFRPRRVIPNTLDPALHGLDWKCVNRMFEGCFSPDTDDNVQLEGNPQLDESNDGDAALKNLHGEGSEELVASWAESGKSRQKLELMERYLEGADKALVRQLLHLDAEIPEPRGRAISVWQRALDKDRIKVCSRKLYPEIVCDSDGETDDDDDDEDHARTAHALFGSLAGIGGQPEHILLPESDEREDSVGGCADAPDSYTSLLTPRSSPVPVTNWARAVDRANLQSAAMLTSPTSPYNCPPITPATPLSHKSSRVRQKLQEMNDVSEQTATVDPNPSPASPLIDVNNTAASAQQRIQERQADFPYLERHAKRRKLSNPSSYCEVASSPQNTTQQRPPDSLAGDENLTPRKHTQKRSADTTPVKRCHAALRPAPTLVEISSLLTAGDPAAKKSADRSLRRSRLSIREKLIAAMPSGSS